MRWNIMTYWKKNPPTQEERDEAVELLRMAHDSACEMRASTWLPDMFDHDADKWLTRVELLASDAYENVPLLVLEAGYLEAARLLEEGWIPGQRIYRLT